MSTKQHFKELDILRGMAIVMVLLGHAIILFPIDLHKIPWCNDLFVAVSSVHMPLFFLISGACYSGDKSYETYIVKKVKRLVVPYLTFCAVDILSCIAFPSLVNRDGTLADMVRSVFLSGGGYWFLYTLFIIFLIFPFVEKGIQAIKSSTMKNAIIGSVLILLLTADGLLELPYTLLMNYVCQYLSYFIVGWLLKKRLGNIREWLQSRKITPIILTTLGVAWVAFVGMIVKFGAFWVLTRLAAIFGIAFFFVLAVVLAEHKCYLLNEFSKYSLPLYLLNGYLLVISRTLFVSVMGITSPVLIIALNMIVTLFASWIGIKFVIDKTKLRVLVGM